MTDEKMTKGERDELRRVVRQDFRVLAEEIGVREAEMLAEIEQHIARRFEPTEDALATAASEINTIIANANTEIAKIVENAKATADGYTIEWEPLLGRRLRAVPVKREEMRRALIADLLARVKDAKAKIHRHESDLLKNLSMGALQSEEARAFLSTIPTVAELVPAARLAELEAQFEGPTE